MRERVAHPEDPRWIQNGEVPGYFRGVGLDEIPSSYEDRVGLVFHLHCFP